MIETRYKELFNIEILHNFYTSGKCPDFEIWPVEDCRFFLKQSGMRFIPTEFGAKILGRVKQKNGKDIIQNPVAEGTKFTFKLRLKNNLFENFTSTNISRVKTNHFYFNNLTENISDTNFPLLLTNTISKTVSDADLLPFQSGAFSFFHTATANTQKGELVFLDSGQSFVQELESKNNVFNFSFDLRKTPGGRAKFLIEGEEKLLFYVVKSSDFADAFGVIEIFYKSSLPASYQFQNADNSIDTKSYKVVFVSRSTSWRYVITRKFNKSVSSVKAAKSNGISIAFSPESNPPPDQFILTSNTPLLANEEAVTGIKLSDQADRVIIPNLPNPDLGFIKIVGDNAFSEILITI